MNKIKIILVTLIGLMTLSSCQSVKDGLSGRKTENSDEFLVQKKSPLSLPPEFEKLPIPADENQEIEEETDIKSLIILNTEVITEQKSKSQSTEDYVLKKIKKN